MYKKINELKKELERLNGERSRSAWARGVGLYALELLESMEENENEATTWEELKKQLLNGAEDWSAYSFGGCSLIYDADICERLATPSEQKRTRGGELNPNSRETWLDCQARALFHASNRLLSAFFNIERASKQGGKI